MPQNLFATEMAAEAYAAGRPDYSAFVSEIALKLTGLNEKVPVALDIGSGTGISTLALVPLADEVIAVEPSPAMLKLATSHHSVEYRLGSAEDLPVETGSCDLLGVGSALHWFDQTRFLKEADRVSTPGAWLIVHDHGLTAEMEGNADFTRWFRDVYLDRFPPPPRDRSWKPPDNLGEWMHVGMERYSHPVPFEVGDLASYLITQSNLQAVIQSGEQTADKLQAWLIAETDQFFGNTTESFIFAGYVATHRR